MKNLALMLSLAFFSLMANATELKVLKVFKSEDAEAGKRYLAYVTFEDSYRYPNFLMVFGSQNGKLKKRVFPVNYGFYPGAKNHSVADDWYQVRYNYERQTEVITMEMVPRIEGRGQTHQMTYKPHESASSLRFAQNTAKQAIAEINSLYENGPKNLKEFKQMVLFTELNYGVYWYENENPFRIWGLQISANLSLSNPNKSFATAKIKSNGSDALSKKFRTAKKWEKNFSEAEALAEEAVENQVEDPVFSSYSTKPLHMRNKLYKKAAEEFVRYEISNVTGEECEGGVFTSAWTIYVLTDGSTISYEAETECD